MSIIIITTLVLVLGAILSFRIKGANFLLASILCMWQLLLTWIGFHARLRDVVNARVSDFEKYSISEKEAFFAGATSFYNLLHDLRIALAIVSIVPVSYILILMLGDKVKKRKLIEVQREPSEESVP